MIEIVNQPVAYLPRTNEAGLFSPGWFHDGAITPDFANVDVRTTQEFPYHGFLYATSDVNPSRMFLGRDLEFNAMIKYFYTDRTLPKKRLSTSEMLEINRLYRVIARDEQASGVQHAKMIGLVTFVFFSGAFLLILYRRLV